MSVTLNPAAHTRIVPAVVFDIKRPQRMVERSIMVAHRSWMVLLSVQQSQRVPPGLAAADVGAAESTRPG